MIVCPLMRNSGHRNLKLQGMEKFRKNDATKK